MSIPFYRTRLIVCLVLIGACVSHVASQEVTDFTALGDPSYAHTLGLTDEQIAQVATILDERRNAIVTATPEDRPGVLAAANEKLAALLSAQQRQSFAELVAGGKLRFRFRNEPWGNVLQWFAGQADLALVMNEVPPGQFTYSDAKNHTPTQAIDLLNSVLQSKGFTLIRREKMLIVAQLTQGLPYDQLPKVTPDELADRGRFEYVSVVFPLEGRPVEQVTQEVTAFLGPNARATPLPTTGQLMVVDTAGRIDAIRKLIASIPLPKKKEPPKPKPEPKPKPPAPVFQVHTAQGLDIGAAVQTLEKLYGDAKFTGDGKVEQITAYTVPARQQAIAQTLAQMTANVTGDNEPRLEIYSVVDQDVGQLTEVLARTHPGVQVSADASSERLLVVGNVSQQADVAQTLEKLEAIDAGASATATGVAVFDVDATLAPKIVDLLKPLIPRSNIVQNENRIAVRGSKTDQEIAKAAIEQLEQNEADIDQPSLRFYRLSRPWETNFLDTIRQLNPDANITKVPNRNQLAIVANEKDYQRLAAAIGKAEAEWGDPEEPSLQQLDVSVDDADRLLSMMKTSFPNVQMFLNQQQDKLLVWTTEATDANVKQRFAEVHALLPEQRDEVWKSYSAKLLTMESLQTLLQPVARDAVFRPDTQRGRLMVSATEPEHQRMQETLASFQGEDLNPAEYEDVLLAYPINRGDPAAVAQMLAEMYPKLKFSPDLRTNKILVTAPLETQNRIQAILEQLDTAPGETDELARTYPVKVLAPSTIVQLLSSSFTNLRMTPQDAQRQIAVIGPSNDHERLKTSIEQLDQDSSQGRVVAYDCGDANPMSVRSVLRQLVPSAIVSATPSEPSVVVWADDQDHAKIKQAIEQYTQAPKTERTTKVYRLRFADPDRAEYILRDILPNARIIEDSQTGTLTATATDEEHTRIADVLKQMDVTGNDRRITEIYRFDRTNARSAERTFERLAPRARISSIIGTNAVVVSASEAEHQLLREVSEKLNGGDTPSVAKVYPLDPDKINADDVLDSIDDALRSRVAIRMNEQTNSLIVRGSEEDQEAVKQLVDELIAQVPPRPKATATVYRLEHSDPDVVADVMRDLLSNARFRADPQTGTLTATALPEEHAEIAKVLKQLDIPSQERQQITEIYRFDRTDADSAERTFQRLIPRARVSSIRGTNSIVVTATAAEHQVFRETADKLNGAGSKSITKVYPLDAEQIDAEDVLASLDDSLLARVSVRVNEAMNSLIIRGTEEDQEAISQLIDEIIAQVPPLKKKVARVYQFQNGEGDSIQPALRRMFDDATFAFDYRNNTLLATASEEDQQKIAALVNQLDQPVTSDKITKVYRLDSIPAYRMDNIADTLISDGDVTYDSESNVIIVSASEADHKKVEDAVNAMNQASESSAQERVYTLKTANPASIQGALERLMPQTKVASDMESRSIIVSADDEEQQRVRQLIEQLDAAPGQEAVMRAYVVRHADGKQTFESLRNTFSGNGNFSLSFQEASKSIFVVATPKNQEIFGNLLSQLDSPILAKTDRTAKTYSLASMSANAARTSMTALLQDTVPVATVEVDELKNQLVVVGTQEQHTKVAAALGQMTTEEADFEVFQLAYVDPWTVESAIDGLFANQPVSATPSVTSDYFSQRLFVRGSAKQIEQVRTLLSKMGESISSRDATSKQGDVRSIPFRGDIPAAIKRIEEIWPRIRKNRIQVVAPSDPSFKLQSTKPLKLDAELDDDGEDTSEEEDDNSVYFEPPSRTLGKSKYVALQDSTRASAPNDPLPTNGANEVDEIQEEDTTVVIVPESDRITIASSDHEALDQLEELLTVMSRSETTQDGSMGGDFAVFLLRNTGASSMRDLLANLFEQLRKSSGTASTTPRGSAGPTSSYGSLFGPMFGSVAVVADDRLNALIIHGDRKERELIEELLTVLDSEDLPNPIIVYQPELVLLQHTQAQRVLAILNNVYRTQLTSGGGRKNVEIPEGVSSEVASVLQQINAAAAAPVLTLDVDETTNSIVMRAPPELRKEIKLFVESLDNSAGSNRSRNVRVVQLKRGKSDRIRAALEQFLLKTNPRGR